MRAFSVVLPDDLEREVSSVLQEWVDGSKVTRLWQKDASLWTDRGEEAWLGWLDIVERVRMRELPALLSFARAIQAEDVSHVLLLGMGGSSLCPEVLSTSFGSLEGFPKLLVLDSTDSAQVRAFERQIDPARTLCIVSSKSGTTLETNVLRNYFYDRLTAALGEEEAGRRFLAITDAGSALQEVAREFGFRATFRGEDDIGGRFSALSNFGLVPAAAAGIDVDRFLETTQTMVDACGPDTSADENPGVLLGVILGVLARSGRDKMTLVTSPGIWDLGAWLEQLVAESTGKQGRGIVPIDGETLGDPVVYGNDRLFVAIELVSEGDDGRDAALRGLSDAGHPVVRITLADEYQLGAEFYRWEFATAVAGSVIGVNPFDQPDVEASKSSSRELMRAYESTGVLPAQAPFAAGKGISLYADAANAAALQELAGAGATVAEYVTAHMGRLAAGDYLALLAYVEMNAAHRSSLQAMRHAVRDAYRVATSVAFGPRFLHSTGQAHKGGPNSGVFLQITADETADLDIPTRPYSFGIVKAAQARGDFDVLSERGRRALRVHLDDPTAGLDLLAKLVRDAAR
jgi:transaldolase/glucose-6-phosphate isomerase